MTLSIRPRFRAMLVPVHIVSWPKRVLLAVVLASLQAGCRARSEQPANFTSPTSVPGHAVSQNDQLGAALHEVVSDFRQTIVLMEDEGTLEASDRPRALVVARQLYRRMQQALGGVERDLLAELGGGTSSVLSTEPPEVSVFLDLLESSTDWHDADKLAFRDAVASLSAGLSQIEGTSPALAALRKRCQEDERALTQIQALYDSELDKVFGRLETRGMPVRRERWEDYLASLRKLHSARDVMARWRDQLAPAAIPAAAAKAVSGARLPPRTLVLSFDDGPHHRHTARILEVLSSFGVRAIFFELGENIGKVDAAGEVRQTRAAKRVLEEVAAGHLVANHTLTHASLITLPAAEVEQELSLTNRLLRQVAGVEPTLFRPPYGAENEAVRSAAQRLGLRTMLWDIDSRDWADPVPRSIANRVIAEATATDHGIILFHDIHARTIEALPPVLETLLGRGFRIALWNGEEILHQTLPVPSPTVPAAAPMHPLYRQSHALVIGVNEYRYWPKLSFAVADAVAMRDTLVESLGFPADNVTLLLDADATRDRILAALADGLADPKRIDHEDRVLVFFAGHGATRRLPSGRSLGHIVPVDAPLESFSQLISMTNFQDINDAIPAKHVLYLMDACYGGLALVRGGAVKAEARSYLSEVTRRTARQMLTAGGADEEVSDAGGGGHSVFTWSVLEGLRGKADLNGDGHVTASELFTSVGPIVSSMSRQTPAFGSLPGSEGGDFVFALRPQDEFLTSLSEQLDDEAIRLNVELDRVRQEIAEKRDRNATLAQELASAQAELARLDGEQRVKTPPQDAQQLLDQGLGFYRERRYDQALAAFQQAFTLRPSSVQAANNIGFVYARTGRLAEAVAWYQKTLALDPQRAVAYLNLAQAYAELGRKAEAITAYERYLELAPNHAGASAARSSLEELRRSGPG